MKWGGGGGGASFASSYLGGLEACFPRKFFCDFNMQVLHLAASETFR